MHMQNIYAGSMMTPEMHFSGKHNGLYLHFSRLLRPLWHRTLLVPTNSNVPLASSVTAEEIDFIVMQLVELKTFIEKNAQMPLGAHAKSDNAQQPDAYLRERQSLMFLQQLLNHSLQVLGLWKVVCEHGFPLLSKSLSPDDQNVIKGMYYRDLIISLTGKEVSGRLIQALIAVYLGDDARTDAISARLRDVCPGLYNQEDALSSKAQEMLIKARNQTNPNEKAKMIKEAISICKDVAAKLNLEVLTSHLVAVHSYIGVLEICLSAASKRDAQGLALHFYKNGEPNEDQQGLHAFVSRSSAYKHITNMIRQLMSSNEASEHLEAIFEATEASNF